MFNLNGTSVNEALPKELCGLSDLTFLYIEEGYNCNDHTFNSFGCHNTERSWFASASRNLILLKDVEKSPFFSSTMQIGCDWLELHDNSSCPSYGNLLVDNHGVKASHGCCYCQSSCIDYPGWLDSYGYDCTWYEDYEEKGCSYIGDYYAPESGFFEGVTPKKACCTLFFQFFSAKQFRIHLIILYLGHCGGGFKEGSACFDDKEWKIDGDDDIDCSQLEEEDSCTEHENITSAEGKKASEACCKYIYIRLIFLV